MLQEWVLQSSRWQIGSMTLVSLYNHAKAWGVQCLGYRTCVQYIELHGFNL